MKFDVYFRVGKKKLRKTVDADSFHSAKEAVLNSIVVDKVVPNCEDDFSFLKGFLGMNG